VDGPKFAFAGGNDITMSTDIVDITTICDTFPEVPLPQIDRGYILDGIDRVFSGSISTVIIEGDGLGKTNILAQFVVRHINQVAMLFIRPSSRWGYDLEYLQRDIANQMNWILTKEELQSEDVSDDVFLQKSYTKIHKSARKRDKYFYFVVDGVDQLPTDLSPVQHAIMNMLPWGFRYFKFLLSGDSTRIGLLLPKNTIIKTFPLPHFSPDETRQYFSSTKLAPSDVDSIHRMFHGLPSHLASIRRLIQFGDKNPQDFLNQLPSHLSDLFELEWKKVDLGDSLTSSVLSIMAHDRGNHTIKHLSRLLSSPEEHITSCIRNLSFVSFDTGTGKIEFASEAFRIFAAERLSNKRREVANIFVDSIFRHSEDLISFNSLSTYLEETERFSELLDYISPEYLRSKLETSQSLQIAKHTAGLGLQAAQRLRRDDALIRFSMQQSALNEFGTAASWRSEVMARMAIRDYGSAMSLAQRTVLQEDRLHLLAVIARIKRQQKSAIDQELSDQIQFLFSQIEWRKINDQAIDIAADLLYTHPDLAINLVESTSSLSSNNQTLDWAFASLYLKAEAVNGESDDFSRLHEIVSARIKDPIAKTFSSSLSEYVKEYSAAQVVAEAEKLDKAVEAIYLVRRWTVANKRRPDAAMVVNFALNLIIRTTAYSPNARDFREIATPLPFISDNNKALELVRSFDGQKGTVSSIGPTEDVVLLMLILAETEIQYDFDAGSERFVESYYYILEISDIHIKANCTAQLLVAVTRSDSQRRLESSHTLHSSTEEDLRIYITQLLEATSDHYEVTQRIIAALSLEKPDLAQEIAMQLNVEPRRNAALRDIMVALISDEITKERIVVLKQLLPKLTEAALIDEVIDTVLGKVAQNQQVDQEALKELRSLIDNSNDILDTEAKCRAYCHAAIIIKKAAPPNWEDSVKNITRKIEVTWEQIDVAWERIEVGFKTAERLAQVSTEYAQHFINLTDIFRQGISFESEWSATSYNLSVRLVLRAYSGLLMRRFDTADHLAAITNLIEQTSSIGEQAALWSDLILYHALSERSDDAKNIASQKLRPLVEKLTHVANKHYFEVLIVIAPALFVSHKVTAFEKIRNLPVIERDRAYWSVCQYLLFKQPSTEPYEYWSQQGLNVSYEDIIDVCDIADQIDADVYISRIIEWVADTLCARSRRDRYSQQQKADLVRRLEALVNSKLPNPRYIRHYWE